MTALEWWLLSTCTAAGLATAFRWHITAAAHTVRGWWRWLRYYIRGDDLTRREHEAITSDIGWMTMESIGGLRRRRLVSSALPDWLQSAADCPVVASAVIRNWPCGCEPWSDPADCLTRRDVTPLDARDREYVHGGPPERGHDGY